MKKEIRVFFTALMYFTRIPCPKWVDHSEEYLNKAPKYLPLIGWIVGGISGIIYFLAVHVFSVEISILLSMIASIMATGAFHEDGFADVCDGFGGGWTKEKILLIMKDSRVGAFGVIGLVMILLLKFILLSSFFFPHHARILIPCLLVSAHAISRFAAVTFLFTHDYARTEESKSKPLASRMTLGGLVVAFIFGILPLLAFSIYVKRYESLLLIVPVYLTKVLLARFFKKWISGYTGDCLGATQQVCEVVVYLSLIVLWKYFS